MNNYLLKFHYCISKFSYLSYKILKEDQINKVVYDLSWHPSNDEIKIKELKKIFYLSNQ